MRWLVLLVVACSGNRAPARELPPVCRLAERVLRHYEDCRRSKPGSLPPSSIAKYHTDVVALWQRVQNEHATDVRVARMCSFDIDHKLTDMAGEDCQFSLTSADRDLIAAARKVLTPTPKAAKPENQAIVDALAAARDAVCACTDMACVDKIAARVAALPLEQLQTESNAVRDALDAIGVENHECATRPLITSPDRWQRVH